jgi:hypothetical protein
LRPHVERRPACDRDFGLAVNEGAQMFQRGQANARSHLRMASQRIDQQARRKVPGRENPDQVGRGLDRDHADREPGEKVVVIHRAGGTWRLLQRLESDAAMARQRLDIIALGEDALGHQDPVRAGLALGRLQFRRGDDGRG